MNPILIQILWVILFWAGFCVLALPEFLKTTESKVISKWVPFLGMVITNIAVILAPFSPQPKIDGILRWPSIIVGIIFTICGILFMMISIMSFRREALKAKLEQPMGPMGPNTLVTTGLYAKIRHPIYTGRVLIAIGWSLTWNSVYSLFIIPIIVWITFVAVIKLWEEPELIKSFGEEYNKYRRNTPALFPMYLKIVLIALMIVIIVFTVTGLIPIS